MISRWLRRFSHSLALQLGGLILIVVGSFLVFVILIPYFKIVEDYSESDVGMAFIQGVVLGSLSEDGGLVPESLLRDPVIKEVSAANPQFRLYVRHQDSEFQIGGPPLKAGGTEIEALLALSSSAAAKPGESCNDVKTWQRAFEDGHGAGSVQFLDCDGETTLIEIGGIQHPPSAARKWVWVPSRIWAIGSNVIIPLLMVIAIIGVVLWLVTRSMRRLAHITGGLDLDRELRHLPRKGVPMEVLPLVDALNELLSRLEQAREQQSFFLAAAAHELRTPLALLRLRLEEMPDDDTRDRLVNDMSRMSGLVEQLLQLMSIRNRALPDEKVNLVRVARSVVADRALLALDQGIEISLETNVEQVMVIGSKRLFEVAVGNLVDNALSVSHAQDTVRVAVDPRGTISVSDEGPGITPEDQVRVFEPFSKHPPGKKGYGLGLAIVDSIMTLVGGSVSVRNNSNKGATFELRFPEPTA